MQNEKEIDFEDPTLADPDGEPTGQEVPPVAKVFECSLVAHILKSADVAAVAAESLEPQFLVCKSHKTIVEIANRYYKDYAKLIPANVLELEFVKRIMNLSTRNSDYQDFQAVLNAPVEAPEYYADQVTELAKSNGVKKAIKEFLAASDNGKINYDKLYDSIEKTRQFNTAKLFDFEDIDQIEETQEKEDWLIKNWLEFGSLGMLSGDPFAGKSQIVCELIGSMTEKRDFGRYSVENCPIILIDAENKKRILIRRLLGSMGILKQLKNQFFRLKPKAGQLPIPVKSAEATVRQMIRQAKQHFINRGQDASKVFVIIDTLRSIFAADEMENSDMKNLLYPLQRVAQEENAAILILHHRPKSGAKYAGQTSIAGACDYLWMWESDKSTMIGKLSLVGTRGDQELPMSFEYRNGRNQYLVIPADNQTGSDEFDETLTDLLSDGPVLKTELIELLTTQTKLARNKIRSLLTERLRSLVIVETAGARGGKMLSLMGVQSDQE
ncbi:MAG: AAA family ATPase [Planctomycetaceae bacterium]